MENIFTNTRLFRALVENTEIAVLLLRDHQVIFANAVFERIFGFAVDELHDGEGFNTVTLALQNLVAQRLAEALPGEQPSIHHELHFVDKSGEKRWADFSITFIDNGESPIALISGVDITKRKRAEEQVRHSHAELRNIIDNLQDTYYRTDLEGNIVYSSNSVYQLLGYTPKELLGTKLSDLYMDPQGREKFLTMLQQNNGKVKNYEAALRRKDGSHVWVATNAHYCFDIEAKVSGVEGTTRDISEIINARNDLHIQHNRLEELIAERTLDLAAANRELEAFCYSVSHDLRSPLRAIDGFSQILLEDYAPKLDDTSRQYLERVRCGAQRMGQLIDDLLKLSRISSGELKKAPIDLSQMASEIAQGLRLSEPQREVDIAIESELICHGDRGLMRVVLDNLFGNAWKYTKYNRRPTKIEFGRHNHNGSQAFFIKDNGAGFDMNYANKLFGAFQRLHPSGEFEGSGIGLATVHRIIQRHGGNVWAQSEPEKGATFYFTLQMYR